MNELDNIWHPEKMLEVQLKEPDDFLKVRETLTRIEWHEKIKSYFNLCHILQTRKIFQCISKSYLFRW